MTAEVTQFETGWVWDPVANTWRPPTRPPVPPEVVDTGETVEEHIADGNPHPVYSTDADLSNHVAAANPHPGYATDADLTAHAATSHGDTHPDLATHDTLGLATDAAVASAIADHEAAVNPHPDLALDFEPAFWMSSSEGGSGSPGAQGNTGSQGAQGEPGADSTVPGPQGEQGDPGAAGPGLPVGGAIGEFPVKASATDFDTAWRALLDADIPASIARDSEVTSAISTHEAAGDPHTGYATDADLTTHEAAADPHTGYLKESVISGLATPAVVLGTAVAAGSTTTPIRSDSTIVAFDATAPSTQVFGDAAVVGVVALAARRDHKHAMPANPVTAHEAAGDPHTGYQKESEKAAANGYASLDAQGEVPTAQLGTGTANATSFLRGDQTWAVPAGGGETDPIVWMGGF